MLLGTGQTRGGFSWRWQPRNVNFLGGSRLQTLVDRALKTFTSLLLGCGCTEPCAVRLHLLGRQLAPQARCQAPCHRIRMGRRRGDAKGEHTSPRPSPPQPCKRPLAQGGWCVLTAGGEECGQFHVLPPSLPPAEAGGNLKGKVPSLSGRGEGAEDGDGYSTGERRPCPDESQKSKVNLVKC